MKNRLILLSIMSIFIFGIIFFIPFNFAQTIVSDESKIQLNPFADTKSFKPIPTEDMSDFIKEDFNTKYGVIELNSNFMWVKTGKIAEYSLTDTKEEIFDISMLGKATLYQEGVLFDDVSYKDKFGSTTIREGNYYIEVTKDNFVNVIAEYREVCEIIAADDKNATLESNVCSSVPLSYKVENQPKTYWELYQGQILLAGNYKWKFEGKRFLNQLVDVQPVKSEDFNEWVWFNSSWTSKKPITIEEKLGYNFINYSVKLNVSWVPGMNVTFSDLRFVGSSETYQLPYFIDNYTSGASAEVWVKTPLTKNSNNTIYMYYVNTRYATTGVNSSVFLIYDDFDGASLSSDWNCSSSVCTVGSGIVTQSQTTARHVVINTKYNLSNFEVVMYGKGTGPNPVFAVGSYGGTSNLWSASSTPGYMAAVLTNDGANFWTPMEASKGGTHSLVTPDVDRALVLRKMNETMNTTYYNDWTRTTSFSGGIINFSAQNSTIPTLTNNGTLQFPIAFTGYSQERQAVLQWIRVREYEFPEPIGTFGNENSTIISIYVNNYLPLNNAKIITSAINFTCNVISTTQNISSITLNITNGSLLWTQSIVGLTTTSYNANFTNSTLLDGNYTWNCIANGSLGVNASSNYFNLTKDTIVPSVSIVYPTNTTYTTNVSNINYTISDINKNSCWYSTNNGVINSTAVNAGINFTNVISNDESNIWIVYCNDSSNHTGSANITFVRYTTLFGLCNSTNNIPYLNFTFKDEITLTDINSSISQYTLNYKNIYSTTLIPFSFSNASENPSYRFCVRPSSNTINVSSEYMRYSAVGYPQRTHVNSLILTNSTTNKILYLLASGDGGYVTFTVMDSSSSSVITSALVSVTRDLGGGSIINIGEAYTDDAGSATFYLSPGSSYYITVTKSGCDTITPSITPSTSSYTLLTSCGTNLSSSEYSSRIDGVKYQRGPSDGVTKPGNYLFEYLVTSNIYAITQAKMEIIDAVDRTVLASNTTNVGTSTCNTTYCYLTINYTVYNGDNIKGRYYVSIINASNVSTGLIMLEGDAYWRFIFINQSHSANSISRFMLNLQDFFSGWGETNSDCGVHTSNATCTADAKCRYMLSYKDTSATPEISYYNCIPKEEYNKGEFNRIVFVFFMITIFLFILGRTTQYEMTNPGAFVAVITFVIIICSYYGLFTLNGLTTEPWLNQYMYACVCLMYSVGYMMALFRRYSQ